MISPLRGRGRKLPRCLAALGSNPLLGFSSLLIFAHKKAPLLSEASMYKINGGQGGIISPLRGRGRKLPRCLATLGSNPLLGFSSLLIFAPKKAPQLSEASMYKLMAVREGFEPSIPCGIHTFQACSFGHSDT